jgi:PAS domain-containing protein
MHWTGQMIAGQDLIYCIGRDITDRKQVEEALRELEEALGQATLELASLRQQLECGGKGQPKQDRN